jgi:hypothetical protein
MEFPEHHTTKVAAAGTLAHTWKRTIKEVTSMHFT